MENTDPLHDPETGQITPAMTRALDDILGADPAGGQRLERAILSLIALFHRPASKLAIDTLLAAPAMPGLTSEIPEQVVQPPVGFVTRLIGWGLNRPLPFNGSVGREEADELWQQAGANLRQLGLIAPECESNPGGLAAPEGVRTYVADRLRRDNRQAWQEGHLRLFRYYQSLLPARHANTLAEMEPLYVAIVHGCAAGAYQEAFEEVYVDRMLQRHALFLGKSLGAYDAWLEVLSNFFADRWTRPVEELKPESQRMALAQAGFALRGAGRFRQAIEPIRCAIELSIELGNWAAASAEAQNLSEILSMHGDLPESLVVARDGVRFSEKTDEPLRRLSARARFGDALHQVGEVRLAARNFRRAERWQGKIRKDLPLLVSVRNYNYSDLLLALGRHDEVRVRGIWALDVSREFQGLGMSPLDIALDKLTIARAAHAQWREAQGVRTVPFMPVSGDEDGDPDAEPGDEDQTKRDTLPASIPSIRSIKQEAIDDNRQNTDHLDCATRAFEQCVQELRDDRQLQYLPAALIARAVFRRDLADLSGAREDLQEAEALADENGMRLYLTEICLERIRLALAADPVLSTADARADVNALWLKARDLIRACTYDRRTPELEELREVLKALAPLD